MFFVPAFDDNFYMRMALEEAKNAMQEGEVPIGAVVVARDQIIARSHNLVETLSDPTAHAEMLAITSATNALGAKYLVDCTLYVTLEPCPMCMAALNWAKIHTLVFAASDPKGGFQNYSPCLAHPKTLIRSHILEEEASQLMKDFFKSKR